MTERAKPLLWALASTAALLAGLLAASLFFLAGNLAQASTVLSRISMCVMSLAQTQTLPLGLLLPLLLVVASAISLGQGVYRYRRERRILTALPLEPVLDGKLGEVARVASLHLYRTTASRPAAFCFGLLRPRIVFTTGLLERLSDEEQVAALWHEAHHARVREPLRCLVARLVASTFFWVPVLRDVFDRYALIRELDADQIATTRTSTSAVAGALHETVATPALAGVVGFADFAAARVDRLFDPATPLPSLFKRTRVALSIGVVALLSLAFTYPANVPVSHHVHAQPMMMNVLVLTPSGAHTRLVPCDM